MRSSDRLNSAITSTTIFFGYVTLKPPSSTRRHFVIKFLKAPVLTSHNSHLHSHILWYPNRNATEAQVIPIFRCHFFCCCSSSIHCAQICRSFVDFPAVCIQTFFALLSLHYETKKCNTTIR